MVKTAGGTLYPGRQRSAFPQSGESQPLDAAIFNRYLDRLVRAAHTDGHLQEAYYRVVRLEQPPTSLLRPGIVRRVLRG